MNGIPSQQKLKRNTNPRLLFSSLPQTPLELLRYLLNASVDLRKLFFSQETIGKHIQRCTSSVREALYALRDLGLISWTNRDYQTCIYEINPILLSPEWHKQLWYWFKRYPPMILPLTLLVSFYAKANTEDYKPLTIISGEDLVFKTTTPSSERVSNNALSHALWGARGCSRSSVKQFDQEKSNKVRLIALALRKRGAPINNQQAISLMSYDDHVLERAVKVVKESSNVRDIGAFFFGLCIKFSKEVGINPDIELIRFLNNNKIRILSVEEEAEVVVVKDEESQPKYTKDSKVTPPYEFERQKRESNEKRLEAISKANLEDYLRRKKIKDAAQQATKPVYEGTKSISTLEAEIEGWKKALAEQPIKHNMDSMQLSLRDIGMKCLAKLENDLLDLKSKEEVAW